MYEKYTRQSLPSRKYRELLGGAICVFNANNAFIIENVLKCDDLHKYDWSKLINLESGKLIGSVHEVITSKCGDAVEILFTQIIAMRNRIIHSFQITNNKGEQCLATKEKESGIQYEITEQFLMEFIELNEKLCNMLYEVRDY